MRKKWRNLHNFSKHAVTNSMTFCTRYASTHITYMSYDDVNEKYAAVKYTSQHWELISQYNSEIDNGKHEIDAFRMTETVQTKRMTKMTPEKRAQFKNTTRYNRDST